MLSKLFKLTIVVDIICSLLLGLKALLSKKDGSGGAELVLDGMVKFLKFNSLKELTDEENVEHAESASELDVDLGMDEHDNPSG